MNVALIKGGVYKDHRGKLIYNNDFVATEVKRIYFIENTDVTIFRGWQGHRIEQRWFSVVNGSFKISFIKIDNWEKPNENSLIEEVQLDVKEFDVLHIPKGYITGIEALEKDSKLMVMSNFLMGETKDEYRYDINYFNK